MCTRYVCSCVCMLVAEKLCFQPCVYVLAFMYRVPNTSMATTWTGGMLPKRSINLVEWPRTFSVSASGLFSQASCCCHGPLSQASCRGPSSRASCCCRGPSSRSRCCRQHGPSSQASSVSRYCEIVLYEEVLEWDETEAAEVWKPSSRKQNRRSNTEKCNQPKRNPREPQKTRGSGTKRKPRGNQR